MTYPIEKTERANKKQMIMCDVRQKKEFFPRYLKLLDKQPQGLRLRFNNY
jgi:hypothetical protein